MRHRLVRSVLVGLAASTAVTAAAQTWQASGAGTRVEAFTQNAARTSRLSIECTAGGQLWFRVRNPERGWDGGKDVAIASAGRRLSMRIFGGADYLILVDAPDDGLSPEAISALKGGGTLTLEGPAAAAMRLSARTFPLAGAAPAIERVERACGRTPVPAPAAAEAPPGLARTPAGAAEPPPPQVAAARAEIEGYCPGGRVEFRTGFQGTAEFNGDGRPDYVLDYGAAHCSTGSNGFCGSGGCTLSILISGPGGYRIGFNDTVRSWSTAGGGGGKAVLVLGLHGSACGRIGAASCDRRMSWDGQRFVPAQDR